MAIAAEITEIPLPDGPEAPAAKVMKGDAGVAQEMMKSSSSEQPQLPVPEDMPLAAQPQGPRTGKKSYTLHAQGLRGGPGKVL